MTPFDAVKAQLSTIVPFANHVGVEIVSVGDGQAEARLGQRPETSNHIGSQHAGAMFTLGEAASGAALAGGFLPVLAKVRPVAATAEIRYVKVAKGTLSAQGRITEEPKALLETLNAEGKVRCAVAVDVRDSEGDTVVEMAVQWYVSWQR